MKQIKGNGGSALYVVIQRFRDGTWAFADCWGKPYTSSKKKEAVKMKKDIEKMQKEYGWQSNSASIIKYLI